VKTLAPNPFPTAKQIDEPDVIVPRTLTDVLQDLDERAAESLAMIAQQAGRHSSIHTEHAKLCTLESAVADMRVALRLAS
jgi:hypothetical protein